MEFCTYKKKEFAFKNILSFEMLADHWINKIKESNGYFNTEGLHEDIKSIKKLQFNAIDHSDLTKHKSLVDFMMSDVVPNAIDSSELVMATAPFEFDSFFASKGFKDLFGKSYDKEFASRIGFTKKEAYGQKSMYAYSIILNKFYSAGIDLEKPFTVRVDDSHGLQRIFKVNINQTFMEIVPTNKLPVLTPIQVKHLKNNINNVEHVMEVLPPHHFLFRGFMLFQLTDITAQEILSSIKFNLLEQDSILNNKNMALLEKDMQVLFRNSNLRLGISAYHKEKKALMNYGFDTLGSLIKESENDIENFKCQGSIYEDIDKGEPIVVEDLKNHPKKTEVEKALLDAGVRSIVIAPLRIENEIIGVLQLTSTETESFTSGAKARLSQVTPLFSVAVKNILEKMNAQIQAIIKEECTVIHPSVEWRFNEAALNKINQERVSGGMIPFEEIVFKNVNPLYGVSDIRGSSTIRNKSIQADLIKHLRLVRTTTKGLQKEYNIPILDELMFRVNKHIGRIQKKLSTGDETAITDFLVGEIDPLFDHFKELKPENEKLISSYYAALDPDLKVVYDKRRAFEESVSQINQHISYYLDEAEKISQKMFPHYFEKYKSDGVEYNIYVGQSLVKNKEYSDIYLKNLRLWQLLLMAEVERQTARIKDQLPMPLELTHLILVHNTPLSIRFRQDERKFDVDGAYNIRYEIVKKRIDKAYIKNTNERLTQPGTIAIVYAQDKEAEEYERYISFLQANGVFESTLEKFELEELPGATGLKALRVKVKLKVEDKFVDETLKKIVSELGEH